jgi:hypothetical protein
MVNLSSAVILVDGDEIICSTYLQNFGNFESYFVGEIVVNEKLIVFMREIDRTSIYRALYEGHKISKMKFKQQVMFRNNDSQINLPICIN